MPQQPPVIEKGTLRILVFGSASQVPMTGVEVRVGNYSPLVTNANGAAGIVVPAGSYPVVLAYADEAGKQVTASLSEITIAKDETTQIIATVAPAGTVEALDIESPAGTPKGGFSTLEKETENLPRGTVEGTIISVENQKPVEGARIFVRGRLVESQSDAQGKFSVELPEGEHALSVIHTNFSTQTFEGVVVKGGEATTLKVELTPASLELDDFVVTAPHLQGTVASLLDTRRESGAASDAIGAEDIARTPAGDAAGAAQRIVGVNIVGGRFVYVRGLGERYTNALLNGLPLPSPEPDRATVPLDLFPTQMISSIDVAKTFTPDMPADFAGGSVRIETVTVPERLLLSVSLSTGWNSQSTFKNGLSYKGGKRDWLGFDDGTRAIPDNLPPYRLQNLTRLPDGSFVRAEDYLGTARELNTNMSLTRTRVMPNVGGNMAIGNGWDFGKSRKLGVVGAFTYSRKTTLRSGEQRDFRSAGQDGGLLAWTDTDFEQALESVRWGAFSGVSYEFDKHNKVSLMGFRSQLSDDQAEIYDGFSANALKDFVNTRKQFSTRAMNLGQLLGEHEMRQLGNAKLDWRVSLSNAERYQPDTRDTIYTNEENNWSYLNDPSTSGRHFFANQGEKVKTFGFDWTQPLKLWRQEHKVKAGSLFLLKDRTFSARRFTFIPNRPTDSDYVCGATFDANSCPGKLFTDENVVDGTLLLREASNASDAYRAHLNVFAGYLMADVALTESLRLVGGSRIESTSQGVQQTLLFGENAGFEPVELNALDVLPSAALIYSITKRVQLRGSGTRTIARPQLREIAPFAFADYFGGGLVSGNPELGLTRILNGDLRLEYFPTPREVLAVSVFVKSFDDPIEPVTKPSGSTNTRTYQNAKGAFMYGMELEARQTLDVLSEALRDFSIIGNLTLSRSEIDVQQSGVDASGTVTFLTNTNRPMVHQSPYVVNLMLDYDGPHGTLVRILYNVSGKQLVEVGTQGLDDAYLHPRHSLDATASQKLWDGLQIKVNVQNMINPEYLITQGTTKRSGNVATRYRDGITASVSLGYTY